MMPRQSGLGIVLLTAGLGAACFSSSSNEPAPDATDLDVLQGVDAYAPEAEAAAPAVDGNAPADVTVEATVDATVDAPVDSTMAPVEAGADSGVVDSAVSDAGGEAADAGGEAGAGTVSSVAGLYLGTTRQGHSSTLLTNGHVLLCGGYYGPSASSSTCDDFDPTTTSISAGPSMVFGRDGHSATLLPNGQVLVAGGSGTTDAGTFTVLQSAEIYDPTAGAFTLVSNPMAEARSAPAVLLTAGTNAGQVVLVGGYGNGTIDSGTPNDTALGSAEVFDPGGNAVNGTFTLLGAQMSARRGSLTAAGLPEGGLLAAGGSYGPGGGPYTYLATAETLDPALSAFTPTADAMSAQRQGAESVTLLDGRVFVFDGTGSTGSSAEADIYDPATRTFAATASLPAARNYAAIALLRSGRVMIAGGVSDNMTVGDVVVYDPPTNTFLPTTGTLNPPRSLATATTLDDGRVIIAGGQTAQGMVTTAVDLFSE
jgi:hypothetical protein